MTVGGTSTATYVYDALNRRIGIDDSGSQTWVVYDGGNAYADFNGSGTLTQRYLYGPAVDELLARTSSGGTTAWYLSDYQGSVEQIANTTGTVIDQMIYDPFGQVVTETNTANGDRFKYAGMEYDSAIGIYYDQARDYNPATGRFLQQDPLGLAAGDVNIYRYVGNNPASNTDPTGLRLAGPRDPATGEASNAPPNKPQQSDGCCCCCAGAGTSAPEPKNGSGLRSVPPSSQSKPSNVVSAETPLGPNDLVIISGNGPVTDPAKNQVGKNDKIPDFEASAKRTGFTLSDEHPRTQDELAAAIEKALGGGRTFNRIILLSHAGGEENGPSADLGGYHYWPFDGPLIHIPDRMTGDNINPRLVKAIRKALGPNGILILGTCGYYCEDPPANGAKPYRTRDNRTADQIAQNEWKENLKKIAKAFGRAVFGDPCDSIPSADPKDAGTRRILTNPVWDPATKTWIPPGQQKNKPRIGADPNGNILP